jgi:hypothetical protein
MGEASCKRVLLNAFTRALKDTFPPTRAAGMITLVATAQYYDAAEVATRIIPAVRVCFPLTSLAGSLFHPRRSLFGWV